MRLGVFCVTSLSAAFLATGCATVDMTNMAVPAASKADTSAEKNIVERAATRLYNAFTNRGFVPKTSRKRVQSAASILLNGLEERDLTEAEIEYTAQGLPRAVVEADIAYASRHVNQATKAAEVYFEMADEDRDVRQELESLEEALMASREASDAFRKVLGQDDAAVLGFETDIESLTRITNKFGERVRLAAAAEMAARRNGGNS